MEQLQNTCRLCLGKIENGTGTLLFTPSETEVVPHAVIDTIRTVLALKVEFNHKWPSSLCNPCEEALTVFKNFKDLCTESERKLQRGEISFQVVHIKEEPEKVYEEEEAGSPPAPEPQGNESVKPVFTLALKDITSLLDPKERSVAETDPNDDIPLAQRIQVSKSSRPVRELRTRYQCSNCTEKFCSKTTQKKHMESFCKKSRCFNCAKCKAQFRTFNKLERHHTREHRGFDDQLKCFPCNLTFEDTTKRRAHFKRDHIKMCQRCKQYLFNSQELKAHAKDCMGKVEVNVEKSQLKKISLKTVEEGFICSHCNEKFVDKSSLICHQGVYHPGKPVSLTRKKLKGVIFCKDCMVFFKDLNELQRHYQQDHSNPESRQVVPPKPVKYEKSVTVDPISDSSGNISEFTASGEIRIKTEPFEQDGGG